VATHGAESWTLNKDITNRLATFERNVLRRMYGENKVNENRRKQYKKNLCNSCDISMYFHLSEEVGLIGLVMLKEWIVKGKYFKHLTINSLGSRLKGRPKNR
jgi:uncharacterized protein YceH (UPF0502 family)